MLPTYCGCYSLTLDGVVYVGASTVTRRRNLNHIWKLAQGTHPCTELQAAFQRTGRVPRFTLLEECDKDQLVEREKYWVEKLGAVNLAGAGVRKGTPSPKRGTRTQPRSPETRKQISLALKAYRRNSQGT